MARIRAFFAALILVSLVAVGFGHLTAEPAAAYYGEMEGFRAYGLSHVDRGCAANITVLYGKRVQVYCNLKNGSSGATTSKSNYYEYSCWVGSGCTYSVYIGGWSGWYPTAVWTMKKTDFGGQHSVINSIWLN